ncbi:hypothetical protein [Mesorhizobium comanense]|uniref:hypothetical protein n=2 Tax=Mesorhizobium comanense TaxID=2502215 RepID=UPI0010F50F84|nr:hypothetical protein [Mesorhizobium comanense]
MVHVIPLSVGQRRRDAGNPVQGADSPPPGEAVQPLDDEWQALAGHYQLRQAQQQAFDTEIAARRLNGELAQAEADAVANAAADGAGLHDAMYGQLDPRTGQVVKTGLFDTLFDDFVKQAPAELRPGLASRKPALREAGSIRMALQQNQRRRDYEQAEVDTALKTGAIAIGNADPDDHVAFEAARQEGLDLIDKMGVDPGIRQQMAKEWFGTAAKARFEALIARDPQRALDMLTTGAITDAAGNDAAGDEPMSWMLAPSSLKAAKGDRIGELTPDERVAQAFGDGISPEQRPILLQRARLADANRQIEMRAGISLAEQNAPEAIRKTGTYSGPMPTEAQLLALYGSSEGGRRFQAFNRTLEISHRYHDMLTMPNDAVRAMVANSEPKPDSVTPTEDKARHEAIAAAADLTLRARQGDPGGYVRESFKNLDAAWNNISKPEDYRAAIAGSIAAQEQLGFETTQPLPNAVVDGMVDGLRDRSQGQDAELSSIFSALPTEISRQAMLGHLLQQSSAQADYSPADRTGRDAIVDPMGLLDLGNAIEPGRSTATGELTNYIPTLQEQYGRFIAGDSPRGSFRRFLAQKLVGSDGLGEDGFSAADLTLLGTAFSLDRAGAATLEGRYGDAALEAVGILPASGLAAPIIKRVGRFAEPWIEKLPEFLRRSNESAGEAFVRGVEIETLRFQQGLARSSSKSSSNTSKRRFENEMLGAMLARDPSRVRYGGATVGWEPSTDYRKTFFSANPKLNPDDYIVHHGVEQQIFDRYPGVFTNEEINSLENLRGIKKEFDVTLHKKVIRREMDDFYATHPTATKKEILDKVTEIDKKYGHLFDHPVGE